ncbi:MAG: aminobenzoyl-glutamate utilization protein [Thermovirga sp.]|jgi:aminobenzoyl-glutamate utilization protein A|nr:aminobenzoyl-glutamate utilization protein [Thermovirga sp.]
MNLEELTKLRRDFHKFAEAGWCEFRTTSIIAETLSKLGYEVQVGKAILDESSAMGRDESIVPNEIERALRQGADPKWIEKMEGYTGALAVLDTGKEGPTIALRFDIDAVEVSEAKDDKHRPYREGFSSVNSGAMHACGHDGHAAIGLGVAQVLAAEKDLLRGKIKLIFQPAEEGVRGGKAIAEKGILDDCDYLLALHLGLGLPTGKIAGGVAGLLCTTKFDVFYKGKASHAGAAPNEGKNALLGAANAVINLQAIAPHRKGTSRINVGVLHAGEGRNVIPPKAMFKAETRGETEEIASYVYERAMKIVKSCASMYDLECIVKEMGKSTTAKSDEDLVDLICQVAGETREFNSIESFYNMGGSDDFSWMMKRVQEKGGKASYIALGADIEAGHHNEYFDFDEKSLLKGVVLMSQLVEKLTNSES